MWSQVGQALNESMSRVLAGLASILPGAAALLLALLVAVLIGVAVRWLLWRLLRTMRFDERVESIGFTPVAEWSPAKSPSLLVARFAYWVIILLGLLIGLAAIDANQMSTMMGRVLTYLPNVFVAVILVLLGGVLARFLSRSVLIGAVNMQIQSARLLSAGVRWMVLVLAVAMALDHLSIGGDVLKLAFGILFGGIVLALALAVGLGSKEMVSRTWEQQADRRTGSAELSGVRGGDHV
ncbi:MAG: mechanosensitive ion channel family protein [Gemmatimonadaceae bacterium]